MKHIPLVALLLSVIALFVALSNDGPVAGADDSLLRQIVQRGVLRVGTTGDYYPFSMRNPTTGFYEGYDIDVAKQLAQDLGVRLEFVQTSWPLVVAGIVSHKYDVGAGGLTMTLERLKSVSFSDSYVEVPVVPLIRVADASKYRRWQDLNAQGIRIAAELGTSSEMIARANLPNATFVVVEPPAHAFQEVQAGRADAAVQDILAYARVVRMNPDLMLIDTDNPVGNNLDGVMTAQGDQIWLNWLNSWIKTHQHDRFFDRLHDKWIAPASGAH
jgi:cyclohexadienyl dehydratase